MKHLYIFCCLLVLITSCTYREVEINNLYSIDVPRILKPTQELNSNASLQYQNTDEVFYMIAIEEDRKQLIDRGIVLELSQYFNFALQNYTEDMNNVKYGDNKALVTNNMQGLQTSFTATHNQLDVFFTLAVLQSDTHFYQIALWTSQANRTKYEQQMNHAILSVSEIK